MKQLIIHRRRDFGDCISDGFRILGNNFKAFLSGFVLYVFPMILVISLSYFLLGKPNSEIGLGLSNASPVFLIALYGGSLIGSIMLSALVYSIFIVAEDTGKQKLVLKDIQPYILQNFRSIIPVYLICFIILIIPFAMITVLSTLNQAFSILYSIYTLYAFYLIVPFTIAPFVKVVEGRTATNSIIRSFQLVKDNWWASFGVLLVSFVICMMAASSFIFPISIITFIRELGGLTSDIDNSGNDFWASFTILFSLLVSMFVSSYLYACFNFKYYDLVEKKEGTSLIRKIEAFGETKKSIFENEGEF